MVNLRRATTIGLLLTAIFAGWNAPIWAQDAPTAPDIVQVVPQSGNTDEDDADDDMKPAQSAVPAIPVQRPVQPPSLMNRPPLSSNTTPTLPTPDGVSSTRQPKPTLSWRARLQRLSASSSPPVVRKIPGSVPQLFPNLLKACNEAGFETKGAIPSSGELWVRSDDTAAGRCNLYFALTENPVGKVILKASTDRNNAAELKVLNSVLSSCKGLTADDDDDKDDD